jgi:hypothetical protein
MSSTPAVTRDTRVAAEAVVRGSRRRQQIWAVAEGGGVRRRSLLLLAGAWVDEAHGLQSEPGIGARDLLDRIRLAGGAR